MGNRTHLHQVPNTLEGIEEMGLIPTLLKGGPIASWWALVFASQRTWENDHKMKWRDQTNGGAKGQEGEIAPLTLPRNISIYTWLVLTHDYDVN